MSEINPTIVRQLTDIQHQAKKLLSGNPDESELEAFARYNVELKQFLLQNIDDRVIRNEVNTIPDVLDVEVNPGHFPVLITAFLALVTLGVSILLLTYLENTRVKRLIIEKVGEARSKYANVEFLIRSRL